MLRFKRTHLGNVKVSVIDNGFVQGADYSVLTAAAATFNRLIGVGALIRLGEGDRAEESTVDEFNHAMK